MSTASIFIFVPTVRVPPAVCIIMMLPLVPFVAAVNAGRPRVARKGQLRRRRVDVPS